MTRLERTTKGFFIGCPSVRACSRIQKAEVASHPVIDISRPRDSTDQPFSAIGQCLIAPLNARDLCGGQSYTTARKVCCCTYTKLPVTEIMHVTEVVQRICL